MHQFSPVVLMALVLASCAATAPRVTPGIGIIESVTQVDRDATRMGGNPAMAGSAGTLLGNPVAGASSQPGGPVGPTVQAGTPAAPARAGASAGSDEALRAGDLDEPRVAAASVNRSAYQVTVRMNDGRRQTLIEEAVPFRRGERVRITEEGRLAPL
jgi:hypothetical protein